MTGFNLPPGCTYAMLDEAVGVDAQCEVCKRHVDDCICPECPYCGAYGDPKCYDTGHESNDVRLQGKMTRSTAQLISATQYEISELKDQIADHESYIQWLEEQQYAEQYRKQTDQE